jgi:hypothetical protein
MTRWTLGANVPEHVADAIRRRAERAFLGELQSIAFAFDHVPLDELRRCLEEAFFAVAVDASRIGAPVSDETGSNGGGEKP